MSDSDERVSYLREAEGHKARKKGENLHPGASKEFSEGFSRTSVGFGSNVSPKYFGRGGSASFDWNCVCGNVNRGWIKVKVGGREVCEQCKQERDYVDKERLGLNDETGTNQG